MTPNRALSTSRATNEFTDMVFTVHEQYRFKPVGISAETGKRPRAPISDKRLSVIGSTLQREFVFTNGLSLSTFTTYFGLCSCPGVDG